MAVLNIVSLAGLLLFIPGCARAEVVTVSAGDTAVLSCTSSSDINITFWSGPPGFSTYNYPGSTTINENLLNADRLEINGTSAELLIHNVKLSDEGSYKCSATHIGTAELQLVVTNIPPYATVIHGIHDEKNKSAIWGTEDQNITLRCSAYGAKPKPNIKWAVAERNTTFNSTVDTVEHANGTFDVTSFYTFVADRLYDNVEFTCSIDHPTLQTTLEKDVVIILYLDATMDGQTEKDDGTNVVGIAVGVPVAFLAVVAAVAIGLYMWRKKSPPSQSETAPVPGRRRFQTKAPGSGGKRFIPTEPGEYDYINPPSGWPRPPHGHRDTTADSGYLHPKPTMMAEHVIEQLDGTKITTRVQAHGVTPIDVPTYTAMLSLTSGEMPATKDGYVTMTGNEGAKDGYITMERKEGTTEARKVDPAAESSPITEEVL